MNKHVKYEENLIITHNYTDIQYSWLCNGMK